MSGKFPAKDDPETKDIHGAARTLAGGKMGNVYQVYDEPCI